MIDVQNLSKYYGDHAAVDNVSFRAERGEILGFLGPNGAGKTTTMRMLTCFLPPTAGTAQVAGFDILKDSMAVRSRVGYLPENVPLYKDLSVTAYLDFVGTLKGMSRRDRVKRIATVMEECGVTDVQNRPIGNLSRGYRQRVGLAQALVNDPEVLILDEPTVGLDPKQIIEIRELIRGLTGRRTVVLSTHILPEVSLICQRVIIINKGALITVDSPENLGRHLHPSLDVELVARGPADAVCAVVGAVAGVREVRVVEATGDVTKLHVAGVDDTDIREAVSAAVVSAGFGVLEVKSRPVSLEDIFVQLVTEETGGDG